MNPMRDRGERSALFSFQFHTGDLVMITPDVGRTLYYYASQDNPLPGSPGGLAAKIVHVHSDDMVNLVVWDGQGNMHAKPSIKLVQPDAVVNPGSEHCQWMPWQVEQAKKAAAPVSTIPQSVMDRLRKAEIDAQMEKLRNAAAEKGLAGSGPAFQSGCGGGEIDAPPREHPVTTASPEDQKPVSTVPDWAKK